MKTLRKTFVWCTLLFAACCTSAANAVESLELQEASRQSLRETTEALLSNIKLLDTLTKAEREMPMHEPKATLGKKGETAIKEAQDEFINLLKSTSLTDREEVKRRAETAQAALDKLKQRLKIEKEEIPSFLKDLMGKLAFPLEEGMFDEALKEEIEVEVEPADEKLEIEEPVEEEVEEEPEEEMLEEAEDEFDEAIDEFEEEKDEFEEAEEEFEEAEEEFEITDMRIEDLETE